MPRGHRPDLDRHEAADRATAGDRFVTALGADYRRLWASSAVATLGDGVRLTALPLLAAAITRDPMAIAGLTVAADLPWLLVSLFAGALVDRTDRPGGMVMGLAW